MNKAIEELIDSIESVARDMRRIEAGECDFDKKEDPQIYAGNIEHDVKKFRQALNKSVDVEDKIEISYTVNMLEVILNSAVKHEVQLHNGLHCIKELREYITQNNMLAGGGGDELKAKINSLEGDLAMSNEAIGLVRGWLKKVDISAAFFADCGFLAVKRITEQEETIKALQDHKPLVEKENKMLKDAIRDHIKGGEYIIQEVADMLDQIPKHQQGHLKDNNLTNGDTRPDCSDVSYMSKPFPLFTKKLDFESLRKDALDDALDLEMAFDKGWCCCLDHIAKNNMLAGSGAVCKEYLPTETYEDPEQPEWFNDLSEEEQKKVCDILRPKAPQDHKPLIAILRKARNQFKLYAELHMDKRTESGDKKARVNRSYAEMCDKALKQYEEQDTNGRRNQ